MAPNSNLTASIITSVAGLWEEQELCDFTVEIDQSTIRCHRFILGACSNFFRALFRSDMKENKENCVKLCSIPLSAFELILKILYTGHNLITCENFEDVWRGAHRLQIPFLIEHCEKFCVSMLSMENYAYYFNLAEMLSSAHVLDGVKSFMKKNFTEVQDGELFLELNAEDVKDLVTSDDLTVFSEDDVLDAIMKWVEHAGDANRDTTLDKHSTVNLLKNECNEKDDSAVCYSDDSTDNGTGENSGAIVDSDLRKTVGLSLNENIAELGYGSSARMSRNQNRVAHLSDLLKASRSCLASPRCLRAIYSHHLVQNDESARKIIFDAILHQVNGYRHGYFPRAAMQRACWEHEHVGIIAYDTGHLHALSLSRNRWYPLTACPHVKNRVKIALFDSDIYVIGPADDAHSKLCVLKEAAWTIIAEFPGLDFYLLSHEKRLYVINAANGEIHYTEPKGHDKSFRQLDVPETITHSEFALSLEDNILIFSKDKQEVEAGTSVHLLRTSTLKWTRLNNLNGPARNMTGFQDGEKKYLLQTNGNVWLADTDTSMAVRLTFVKKLWDFKESLRGALVYGGKLFIYGKLPRADPFGKILPELEGVYHSVQTWARHGYASNMVSTIMNKDELLKNIPSKKFD